nr:UDP-glycosyltransferase 73E1-like [Tanacetum cinerariifolium]
MVEIARILAQRGAMVTIVTTPANASRFKSVIDHACEAKLKIQVLVLPLATSEVGLPVGCENYDLLPSAAQSDNLFASIDMLEEPRLGASRWGKGNTEASIRRFERRQESGKGAYGIVVNSFEELEPKYVEAFIKAIELLRDGFLKADMKIG